MNTKHLWRLAGVGIVMLALIGIVGALSKDRDLTTSAVLLVGGSVLFFLVTNLAVWAFSPWYEKSLSGLLFCYELGLPLLRNVLLGDFFYAGILLAAPALVRKLSTVGISAIFPSAGAYSPRHQKSSCDLYALRVHSQKLAGWWVVHRVYKRFEKAVRGAQRRVEQSDETESAFSARLLRSIQITS